MQGFQNKMSVPCENLYYSSQFSFKYRRPILQEILIKKSLCVLDPSGSEKKAKYVRLDSDSWRKTIFYEQMSSLKIQQISGMVKYLT